MTMPTERMRAVRFGMEMLQEAVSDPELSRQIRQRADQLLRRYPSPAKLEALLSREHVSLPIEWAEALNSARAFLMELRSQPGTTAVMRRSVEVTLRHYPDEFGIEHLVRHGVLAEWFAPESARD